MWTNLLARTYAWMVLLQRTGVINKTLMNLGLIDQPLPLVNNLIGVTIGMTYIMLPFVILPLRGVIKAIDPSILQAASLCGATRWQCLTQVLIPLATPGIAAGALMVFVMSLGYFVTPALLGGTANMMLAELIAQFVQSLVNWGMGGAAAFVLLVVTLAHLRLATAPLRRKPPRAGSVTMLLDYRPSRSAQMGSRHDYRAGRPVPAAADRLHRGAVLRRLAVADLPAAGLDAAMVSGILRRPALAGSGVDKREDRRPGDHPLGRAGPARVARR